MTRDNFLKGALILTTGILVSRALGAVYRFFLPLAFGGGEQAQVGLGLFNYAYPLYTFLLGVSATGVPSAIAKLVAENVARGDEAGVRRVFRVSLILLAVLGLAFSIGLYLVAPFYANRVVRDPLAALSVQAIAPAIFLVSVMSAYRGYFQGRQNMTPSALSQVIEQVVRIGTLLLLARLLLPFGIEYSAAGATFGAVTGAVAGLAYLLFVVWRRPSNPVSQPAAGSGDQAGDRGVLREILRLAVPISLVGVILPLMSMIDATIVPMRLHVAGLGDRATALYGVLTGMALPFVIAPIVFTTALAMSLIPSVSEAIAVGSLDSVRHRSQAGLRAALMISLPASAGLFVLAREIPIMFYNTPEAGPPLAVLAIGALVLGIQQTSSAILQGLGIPEVTLRNLAIGAAFKLIVTWYLTAVPSLNITGAALGTTIGFLAAAWLNQHSLGRATGRSINWVEIGIRPLGATLIMVVLVRVTYLVLDPYIGLKLATLAGITVGGVAYPFALVLLGGVTPRDLELIPGIGPRFGQALQRMNLLRK